MRSVIPIRAAVPAVCSAQSPADQDGREVRGDRRGAVGRGEEAATVTPICTADRNRFGSPRGRPSWPAWSAVLDRLDLGLAEVDEGHFRAGEDPADEHEEHHEGGVEQGIHVHAPTLSVRAPAACARVLSVQREHERQRPSPGPPQHPARLGQGPPAVRAVVHQQHRPWCPATSAEASCSAIASGTENLARPRPGEGLLPPESPCGPPSTRSSSPRTQLSDPGDALGERAHQLRPRPRGHGHHRDRPLRPFPGGQHLDGALQQVGLDGGVVRVASVAANRVLNRPPQPRSVSLATARPSPIAAPRGASLSGTPRAVHAAGPARGAVRWPPRRAPGPGRHCPWPSRRSPWGTRGRRNSHRPQGLASGSSTIRKRPRAAGATTAPTPGSPPVSTKRPRAAPPGPWAGSAWPSNRAGAGPAAWTGWASRSRAASPRTSRLARPGRGPVDRPRMGRTAEDPVRGHRGRPAGCPHRARTYCRAPSRFWPPGGGPTARSRWCPYPPGRGPQLVGSFAEGIARIGRAAVPGAAWTSWTADPRGESGGNSAFRLASVWRMFSVPEAMAAQLASAEGAGHHGPVLLVDDRADSRWTLTEAGRVLREAGASGRPAARPRAERLGPRGRGGAGPGPIAWGHGSGHAVNVALVVLFVLIGGVFAGTEWPS